MNPDWEPYSPQNRLTNLHMIRSKFQVALVKGSLCVQQDSGSHIHPIRWLWKNEEGDPITPESFSEQQFCKQVGPD